MGRSFFVPGGIARAEPGATSRVSAIGVLVYLDLPPAAAVVPVDPVTTSRDTRSSLFSRFARATSRAAGRPVAFTLAVALVLAWGVSGPIFDYSAAWQLVINTTTTIVTFLMVFLMQSTQNRDTEALQLKIDELIRAVEDADDAVMALDEADEPELEAARAKYLALANGDVAAVSVTPPSPRRPRGPAPRQ